jgi:hypothetical protein
MTINVELHSPQAFEGNAYAHEHGYTGGGYGGISARVEMEAIETENSAGGGNERAARAEMRLAAEAEGSFLEVAARVTNFSSLPTEHPMYHNHTHYTGANDGLDEVVMDGLDEVVMDESFAPDN